MVNHSIIFLKLLLLLSLTVGTESVFVYLYRKKLDSAVNQKCHCKEHGYLY